MSAQSLANVCKVESQNSELGRLIRLTNGYAVIARGQPFKYKSAKVSCKVLLIRYVNETIGYGARTGGVGPACITTAVLIAAGAASAGRVTALVAKRFRAKIGKKSGRSKV